MKKIQDFLLYKEKNIRASKAEKILRQYAFPTKKKETIYVKDSANRILAENIVSKFDIPKFDNAAVDGYAFNIKDCKMNIRKFELVGSSKPGKPFNGKIKQGQAIKIFTGALILPKFKNIINVVVMKEFCEESNNIVIPSGDFFLGQNIRKKGEDIKKGKIIIKMRRKIRIIDLGFLSSIGLKKVKVFKKLSIGIFSTGNEIITDATDNFKNKIFDSNMLSLFSMLERLGCEPKNLGIIKDNYEDSKRSILKSLKICDILITTGGISSSETDHIKTFMLKSGNIKFSKIAIKPGRPFSFAIVKKKPLLGLPGNPVAVIVVFLMFVVNFIRKISGINNHQIHFNLIPSSFDFKKKKNRKEWIRGSEFQKNGKLFLKKFPNEGSGILSSIFTTQGIIELDEKTEYIKKGDLLKFYRYEDILN